ncbi:MAG: hypothetical protein GC179_18395 [Anaerolineaceae bacterium]|nr:hypothetical protein [Anaerolineaceae bacterium]
MGLTTSHNCFEGGYSRFSVWRVEVAKAVGIPLALMEGYYEGISSLSLAINPPKTIIIKSLEGDVIDTVSLANVKPEDFDSKITEFERDEVLDVLPISWDMFKPDPIIVLLNHSGCDGIIEAKDCLPLAERLEEILPQLPVASSIHGINMQFIAKRFSNGLRLAASCNEDVVFG